MLDTVMLLLCDDKQRLEYENLAGLLVYEAIQGKQDHLLKILRRCTAYH